MLERELEDEMPESARKSFELAMKAARRQRDHVKALLEYAEATEQASLYPEPVDLTGPVEAAVRGHAEQIEAADAAVEVHDLPDAAVPPDEVRVLFDNLLGHLLDRAGSSPEVHVAASELPQAWLIEVRDRDAQPADARRENAFDLFSRPDEAAEASDVGLAICQAIVRRRGGEIAFEADEAGSGFQVRLPKRSAGGPESEPRTQPEPGSD